MELNISEMMYATMPTVIKALTKQAVNDQLYIFLVRRSTGIDVITSAM
jgi:hypothetical protein